MVKWDLKKMNDYEFIKYSIYRSPFLPLFSVFALLWADPLLSSSQDDNKSIGWLKDFDYTFTTELGQELRLSTAQSAPKLGETDYRGFTLLRSYIDSKIYFNLPNDWRIHAGIDAYYDSIFSLKGRDDFSTETLEEYEKELELRELFLHGTVLQNIDLKVGRQILIWGNADFLRAVDVLNPLDSRDPGLRDLEDIRLPVAMTRFDYYYRNWDFELVLLHEFETDQLPPLGSEFYPFPFPLPPSDFPSYTLDDPGIGPFYWA